MHRQLNFAYARWGATAVLLLATSCQRTPSQPVAQPNKSTISNDAANVASIKIELPLGLPEFYVRKDNPLTHEKIAVGQRLFFDKNLSSDRSMSCATCHDPEKGWGNGEPVAVGVNGHIGRRNVPTILNAAYYRALFWDGRAGSLEGQALSPILSEEEMGIASHEALVARLKEDEGYQDLFDKAFSTGITATNVALALASYQRTIVAGNSPYDRFMAGDKTAMSEAAQRGMKLFMDERKTKCVKCHEPPMFIAMFYHNLGVGMDQQSPDLGRYEITKLESNKGKFKVPTVRDVKLTAPYMHDGSMATLEEVVDFYDKGGLPNPYMSKEMRGKLNLTKQEKSDLVTFMVEGLTSDTLPTP